MFAPHGPARGIGRFALAPVLPPALMVLSGLSLYAGAAVAVGLFEVLPPAVVAWLRLASAGVILLVLRRPPVAEFLGRSGVLALAFGLVTIAMNMTFYEAIARLPLGTAVAIEFLGPIVVAACGSSSVRDWLSLILAALGVVVLSGAQWSTEAAGVLFALGAAALWAGYIVVGHHVSGSPNSLAIGFFLSALVMAPLALVLWPGGPFSSTPPSPDLDPIIILGLAAGLGVLSAVIPYSLDQVILRVAGQAYFAVLLALLPLTAAVLGAVALGQRLSGVEIGGIVLVVTAVALRKPASGETAAAVESPVDDDAARGSSYGGCTAETSEESA
ncbi:EamA family transporter [Corynebacterium auriscanis]|uniref:EamA family transporter n=1 Tax=Corynebacterium auriscanis TaxID=99807 RepID=UPI0024AD9C88|nr:EamA family transporter [Corynebacterium auriscanis]